MPLLASHIAARRVRQTALMTWYSSLLNIQYHIVLCVMRIEVSSNEISSTEDNDNSPVFHTISTAAQSSIMFFTGKIEG